MRRVGSRAPRGRIAATHPKTVLNWLLLEETPGSGGAVREMRKVFSSNEVSETALVRDALVHDGVEVTVQNEYSGRSAVPGFRPPAEIWVKHDGDYAHARQIVVEAIAVLDRRSGAPSWVCTSCREQNPPSFEFCWNCGRDKVDIR